MKDKFNIGLVLRNLESLHEFLKKNDPPEMVSRYMEELYFAVQEWYHGISPPPPENVEE